MAINLIASMVAICTSLIKNVETTFYGTSKHYGDTVIIDEYAYIDVLRDIILSSISRATNMMRLEESQSMQALVAKFLLPALISCSLPSKRSKPNFNSLWETLKEELRLS